MKHTLAILALTFGLCTGCAKNVVVAPVPGSTGTPDAIAFRIAADAQAALHSIKTWEQCSAASFPQTIMVDTTLEPCDPKAGPFPASAVPLLNGAITAYNDLVAAGKAFHDGTTTDATGLQALETQLQNNVSAAIGAAGGK
jgi:hypothetical protein